MSSSTEPPKEEALGWLDNWRNLDGMLTPYEQWSKDNPQVREQFFSVENTGECVIEYGPGVQSINREEVTSRVGFYGRILSNHIYRRSFIKIPVNAGDDLVWPQTTDHGDAHLDANVPPI